WVSAFSTMNSGELASRKARPNSSVHVVPAASIASLLLTASSVQREGQRSPRLRRCWSITEACSLRPQSHQRLDQVAFEAAHIGVGLGSRELGAATQMID